MNLPNQKKSIILANSPFFPLDLPLITGDEKELDDSLFDVVVFLDKTEKKEDAIKILELIGIKFNSIKVIDESESFNLEIQKYNFIYCACNSITAAELLKGNYRQIKLFKEQNPLQLMYEGKLSFPLLCYLADNSLYYCNKIHSYLKEKRYRHVISVAKTAYMIAENNSLDSIKLEAFISGLFHDISKDLESSFQLELGKKYSSDISYVEPFAYHQYASCLLAKEQFGLDEEKILEAISCHCTGKKDMSPLDMILYTADKVEPLRDFPTEELRNLAYKSYKDGFVAVLEDQMRFFVKNGISFKTNPFTKQMYQSYLEDGKVK